MPVPGLSVSKLAKPLGVGVRVDITRGGKVLALDVPAKNVVEEFNRDQTVPKQISLELPLSYVPEHPLAALNNFGHRLHVWQVSKSPDGTETLTDRGWFIVTDWYEGQDAVTVTGRDLMLRLEENPLTWPSSPKKGATLYDELQRLAGDLPVQIDHGSDVDKTTKRSWEWGNSRTEAIQDIAATKSLDYEVRPDGYLHFWPTKFGKYTSRTYTCRDLLLDAPRTSKDRIANRFVAYGTNGDSEDEKQFSAAVTNYQSPYDKRGYGVVTEVIELDSATSQRQVVNAANAALSDAQIANEKRSVEIVPDPTIRGGDVCGFVTEAGENFVGRVTAYSLPLDDVTASMRVDVEVLQW